MCIVLSGFAAGLVIYWTFNNLFSTLQQYIIMTRMGVKVDIIGNILGRNKPDEIVPVGGKIDAAKEAVEEKKQALLDKKDEAPKEVSKPKPKKSKKKK